MARGKGKTSSEHRDGQHAERNAGRATAPNADHEGLASPETEIASPYATSLLGDARLSGRGNRPVQIATMRSMQQAYGNRAMQRFLQRTRSADAGGRVISPQGPSLIQGLPLTSLLSLPMAVQRQGEGHDDDEEQGSGEVAMLGPASAPSEQEELPVQTTRAHTTPLPVQRQDPPTKTKPAPTIPSGSYVVAITNGADGQGYEYTFNSEDVKKWGNWGNTAFGYYIRDVFKGGTDTIAAEYLSQEGIDSQGDAKASALKRPTTRIGIAGGLHTAVVQWMAKKHPEVLPRGTSAGYHDLGEQHGGGQPASNGSQNGQPSKKPDPNADVKINTGGADVASADLQKIRELFEFLRKNYPDHVVFSESGLTIEDFLQFLADNPDALKRLPPPPKTGGIPAKDKEELKSLLDKVQQHHTSGGSKTGSPKGSSRGVEGGVEGGVIKFEPVGKLLLTPDEDKYVKGSNLRMRVDFDRSDSQRALLNVFPGRASFDWTIWRDGKRYDDGPTLESLGGYNEYDVDLGEPGSYTVQVNVKSPRFKDDKELDLTSKPLVVVEEKEREKEIFDKTLVGKDDENMPFERDEKGNLKLKGGRKPLTVEEELTLIDLQVGAINSLAAQGKISASDKENFTKYFEAQRKALEGIKTKATGKPYFVRGTFLSRETSSHMEVKAYMSQTKREKEGPNLNYGVILHDTTLSPDNPTQHPGEGSQVGKGPDDKEAWAKAERKAVDDMVDHWHSHNDYPKGKVHLGIKMNEDDSVYEKVIETDNARKSAKKWLGYVATAAGVVMLAAAPFTGGTSAGVGVILLKGAFITAAVTGTAAMLLEVQDRYEKEGELKFDGRLMLDILQVVTLALGAVGTFSNALKVAGAVGKGMFLATMAGLDVAQGVLISDQVRQQIIGIEAQYSVIIGTETDPAKKEMLIKERNSAVAQVLGAAAVNGGFILISLASGVHQMVSVGRMSGKRYTVREEFKGIVEGNDPAAIRRALDEHSAGTKVLTHDERAYLEEALAKTPTKKPEEAGNTTGNTGNNKTTPTTPETPREIAVREAAADDLAKQGLAKLEKLFGAKKVDEILGAVPKDEMNGFLKTIDDPAFTQQLGHDFFKGLATRPEAMQFARTYGGDLLATFYRRYGWTTELIDSLRQAGAKLNGAATPEARQQMIEAMKAARDKAALDKILGKAPPPKPARAAKATKATMGVDRSHSSWKAFRADAVDDAKAHGETLTPEQLDIRADLEMVRDRAKRGHLDNLGHDSKLSILDRFDELAKQSGMAQGPLNGKRGDLAESLFNPDYGTKRHAFKGGKEFNLKDVPQNQRNTYTKPDYRLDETGVVEWVEQKSDLIDRGTKSGDVFTSGKAAANEYVKHAKSDAPDLPPGDKYSIDFIRDPGAPTRQAMLDILFAPDSPIYRVKFGETWYTRP